MANDNPTASPAETSTPSTRAASAEGAFDVAAARIPVEDLSTYGSRFAHDEHRSGKPVVEPDGAAEIAANNRARPFSYARAGRIAAFALAGVGLQRVASRMSRRQRRTTVIGVLGAAVAAIGIGTWISRRKA